MPIITPAQAERLGQPPRPLAPQVAIVEANGRPTQQFHAFLTQQYEFLRRLITILTE